jgi:hypothetical protein
MHFQKKLQITQAYIFFLKYLLRNEFMSSCFQPFELLSSKPKNGYLNKRESIAHELTSISKTKHHHYNQFQPSRYPNFFFQNQLELKNHKQLF